ncbi:hypothetical protein BT93_B2344 [Corymbia citriodora subsp. variegata]|nr:hypothetical protein BT93_B2344 [Corymbia citriodora subsp. variegata]
MEFLQRCIFPRCTFSMSDAVYCAMFVHTLHSLGTPFFNTVNHIDVLICKTLQPMICCCTEYEVGRLGRFLYETLKTAYYWKSDESIYERECGNMPGFAVYYRYPNSQRVTYGQFIKVHWKWSQRITRLLIQCLESTEYMEIRNALIMLTKISGVFPVTRKSGINLEKRVAKIKSDEREDLKVLATGVAAAMAARKPSWVTDEEFGMGYLEVKPPSLPSKSVSTNLAASNGPVLAQNEHVGGRGAQTDVGNSVKEQALRIKNAERGIEKADTASGGKTDSGNLKVKGGSAANGSEAQLITLAAVAPSGSSHQRYAEESAAKFDESITKAAHKDSTDSELKASTKRTLPAASLSKPPKQDGKDEKSGKIAGKSSASSTNDRNVSAHTSEGRQVAAMNVSATLTTNGNAKGSTPSTRSSTDVHGVEAKTESGAAKSSDGRSSHKDDGNDNYDVLKPPRLVHSPRHESSLASSKSGDKLQKRSSPSDEADRVGKRRKGDSDSRDSEGDARFLDLERSGSDEQSIYRNTDKILDRTKERVVDRYDRDYRERPRGDDVGVERARDRSMERYVRERSVDRVQERSNDRSFDRLPEKDRVKDDRSKLRHGETALEKVHGDERFHGQSLPPPPPLPPHMVPQSVGSGRRDEDSDRRFGVTRHAQRLSPRHDERERRRSEENIASQDDAKRKKEDDFRDRKREEREGMLLKVDERERDRDKANLLKEEMDANPTSKRRKLKREHLPSGEPGEFSPVGPPPAPTVSISQSYDGRDRGERKALMTQRPGYIEEPVPRMHGKEVPSKIGRRDVDPMYEREWDDEKRQRAEQKRRHRK